MTKNDGAIKNNMNNYVYPDGPLSSVSNYCRNPTKDPTGVWCYVGDGTETDLCDVSDCSGGDSETLLTGGGGVHWLYVLPEWKNAPGLRVMLKRWAANAYAGFSLRFRRTGTCTPPPPYDLIQVGADRGEKIKLYRVWDGIENTAAPTDGELVYPHIVMAGRWTELLFEFVDDRDVIMSSAAGGQIFRWTTTAVVNSTCDGRIAFVGLSTVSGDDGDGYIGARFPAEGIIYGIIFNKLTTKIMFNCCSFGLNSQRINILSRVQNVSFIVPNPNDFLFTCR